MKGLQKQFIACQNSNKFMKTTSSKSKVIYGEFEINRNFAKCNNTLVFILIVQKQKTKIDNFSSISIVESTTLLSLRMENFEDFENKSYEKARKS